MLPAAFTASSLNYVKQISVSWEGRQLSSIQTDSALIIVEHIRMAYIDQRTPISVVIHSRDGFQVHIIFTSAESAKDFMEDLAETRASI